VGTKNKWVLGIVLVILVFWVLITVIPLYWMFVGSLQDTSSQASFQPTWWPEQPTLSSYERFFNKTNVWQWTLNSIIVSSVITITNVVFASLAGYAFAKLRFPGQKTIFWTLLATMMIPAQVTLIPLYILMINVFKLGDTYAAVILPSIVSVSNIFLMKQYMSTLPSSLIDAARIDACSEFGIFRKVILPMCKPGIAVLSIFTFVANWNDFFWPFLVTQSDSMRTLQVGLATFKFAETTDFTGMMAGATVAALPMIVLFFALQRYFLQGITIGAVKG
jgi:multiple sugar transport system permease protein